MTPHLSRLQWAVRAVLALGVAASVTANILHARDNLISQAIAAWPPLALLVTVELVTRVPVYNKALGAARILATAAIAAIAAWISYHHMVGVVARYGETGTVPYLLPLSVDGLIVVASICLVELSGRHDETLVHHTAAEAAPALKSEPASEVSARASTPLVASESAPISPGTQSESQLMTATPDRVVTVTGPERPLDPRGESAFTADPVPEKQPEPAPEQNAYDDVKADDHDVDDAEQDGDQGDGDEGDGDAVEESDNDGIELSPDLVPLLPAARVARDELIHEGHTVSRDALAARLRRNGHAIRNNRVSELQNALRREEPTPNGARPTVSA